MVASIPGMLGVHMYKHFAYNKTDDICFYKSTVYDSILEYNKPETVLKVHRMQLRLSLITHWDRCKGLNKKFQLHNRQENFKKHLPFHVFMLIIFF